MRLHFFGIVTSFLYAKTKHFSTFCSFLATNIVYYQYFSVSLHDNKTKQRNGRKSKQRK